MSFSQSLVSYFRGIPEITALVGEGGLARIRPNKLKQGDLLPAIRYYLPSTTPVKHLEGAAGLVDGTLQLDCYGQTRAAAHELAELVRNNLDGYGPAPMNGTWVDNINLETRMEMYEDGQDASEQGKHRDMMIFQIWYAESIPQLAYQQSAEEP